jgi:16S rRNA (guanine527-N7)-methyltransferase
MDRAPLPVDADGLPELGPAYRTIVLEGCAELGIELSAGQLSAIDAHARLLLAWNAHINLTALRTEEQVARLHVLDSLSAVAILRGATGGAAGANKRGGVRASARSHPSVLDLGSGGGYPGIPIGVALPASRVALVDSVGKKARFLDVAASASVARLDAAERPHMAGLRARAEELAADPDHREAWDVVTARAVGSLAEVVELSLPLLRIRGRLIAWKRDDGTGSLKAELDEASQLIRAAGGGRPSIHTVHASGLEGHRLVEIGKIERTPGRFPRPPAERRRP